VALAVKELKQQLALVPNGDSLEPVSTALDQLSALISGKDQQALEENLTGGCCEGPLAVVAGALEVTGAGQAAILGQRGTAPALTCSASPPPSCPAVAVKEEAVVAVVSCCQELMATGTQMLLKSLEVRRSTSSSCRRRRRRRPRPCQQA
jgi:hypothetical protein